MVFAELVPDALEHAPKSTVGIAITLAFVVMQAFQMLVLKLTVLPHIRLRPSQMPIDRIENSITIFPRLQKLISEALAQEKQTNGISFGDAIDYDRFVEKFV